ncbi:MAG: citrate transporter [Lachnospiraceae bacterium]|nr:citrate transporter [Lachnospiraceae bacterium]
MKKIINKIQKVDAVLCIAWILAVVSAFFVHPDKDYLGYIDFRSLGILWGLMVIIQGIKENSVFDRIAGFLLSRVKKSWQLAAMLIFMCFFGSMLITNDVALITFVPFALMILRECDREDMIIPTVVLQTIAANLGSMLTPIGNPQNLYLYGISNISLGGFVLMMLPFCLVSAAVLLLLILIIPGKKKSLQKSSSSSITGRLGSKHQIIIYTVLFAIALSTVLRILPWYVFAIIVLFTVGIMDHKILFRADYTLLLTFVGFFIFVGNMGRIEVISSFLEKVLVGHEFPVSVALSQVTSNVPATLMLSGFTTDYRSLLIGVNVGGLGTLIASMASLISYKAYAGEYKEKSGKYLLVFTGVNVLFLIVLVAAYALFR